MRSARMAAILTTTVALTLTSLTPAAAAPLGYNPSLAADGQASFQEVRWRGHHHWRGHQGWRNQRYGWGPAFGGLAAGALIGGAIANSQARADAVTYCSQRFKSYDPASGTYLGYDGLRHPCP